VEEEEAVDVVLDRVADLRAEREEHDLRDREERRAEEDVAERPAVRERAEHEHELAARVHRRAHDRPQQVDDPQRERLRVREARDALERRDCDEHGHAEDDEAREPQKLRASEWGCGKRSGGRTQSESGVPSSANWKPTKPFTSRQQYAAATRPVYTAANH
jgi:hypothetical protein